MDAWSLQAIYDRLARYSYLFLITAIITLVSIPQTISYKSSDIPLTSAVIKVVLFADLQWLKRSGVGTLVFL